MNRQPVPSSSRDAPPATQAKVQGLHAGRGDREIVDGLKAGERWARAALFDRYSSDVQRVLCWVMGFDSELPDLLHDVFLRAFEGIGALNDAGRVRQWLVSTAVYVARERIRKRSRPVPWWFWREGDPEPPGSYPGVDLELVSSTRAALARLDPEERIVITLRYMAGFGLEELADSCGVSIATVKRRLAAARSRFEAIVHDDPVLEAWVKGEPDE